jgi:hypothetical protein
LSASRDQAEVVFDGLNTAYANKETEFITISVSSGSLTLLAKAIAACVEELGDEEFLTRVGYELHVARTMMNDLRVHH